MRRHEKTYPPSLMKDLLSSLDKWDLKRVTVAFKAHPLDTMDYGQQNLLMLQVTEGHLDESDSFIKTKFNEVDYPFVLLTLSCWQYK
jgi:hypothetical protein